MQRQAFLRKQAARCLQLADAASREPGIARALRAIAQAFLCKAAELDAEKGRPE